MTLRNKEHYLARYMRKGIPMSMQAKTTSPVESMNEVTKHGPHAVNSNMNLSKSIETMAVGADARLSDYSKESMRELGTSLRASRAPTKDVVHRKTQYLMDQNWDKSSSHKYAQISEEQWLCWNFYLKHDQRKFPWTTQANFHRVWTISIVRKDNQIFAKCGDCYHVENGHPCSCFYGIFCVMDASMVNIQHLKTYSAHYGRKTELGAALHVAQAKQEEVEGCGVPINKKILQDAQKRNKKCSYPFLFEGTDEKDYRQAQFVMSRVETSGTTSKDLEIFCGKKNVSSRTRRKVNVSSQEAKFSLSALNDCKTILTDTTKQLHLSQQSALETVRLSQTQSDRHDTRKELVGHIDFVLNHPDFGVNEINSFSAGVKAAKNLLVLKSNARMIQKRERKKKRKGEDIVNDQMPPMVAWMSSIRRVDFFVIHDFISKHGIKELQKSFQLRIDETNKDIQGVTSKDHIKLFMHEGINDRLDVTMYPIILDRQQLLTLECNIREDILVWFKQRSATNQLTKKDTTMTWAAKTSRRGPQEKRKKGCAG